jgi:hypothetical protein
MEEKNIGSKYYLKVIILLLIGFIVGFSVRSFLSEGKASDIVSNKVVVQEDTNTASSTFSNSSTIFVTDQKAGSFVTVSNIALEKETWVAVGEDNGNGKIEKLLGASLFFNGTKGAVEVSLLRPTESGKDYHVIFYTDDGDRIFDLKKDQLWNDENGGILAMKFKVK